MSGFDATDLTLPEVWASHARNRPDHPALVCDDEVLPWGDFNARMNRLSNALRSSGVQKGDRIAVLASSSIATCVAMFGAVLSGAAMTPISPMLTKDQILAVLHDCGATHVMCSSDLRHLIDPIAGALPDLRCRIGTDFEADGWCSLESFCAHSSCHEADVALSGEDVFSIMYSSGTTGMPKGVVHTHAARTYFCISNALEMRFAPEVRGLVTTALYTAGTWLVLMPTLFVGGTLHIHRQYNSRRFINALSKERISHTFTVPSQLRSLLADDLLADLDLPHLRVLLSAGSPLRPFEKTRLMSSFGDRFYELYGFTEGGSTLLRPEDQATKPLSVGRPLMGQQMLILNSNDVPCPHNESGEIVARGPGLLASYLGKPDETRAALWRDDRGRSYVRSGDIGRIDEDGFLFIVDRKKDMIISGGLNVYPADIEAVLSAHPDIADVCVIGVDHERWGESPLALVVLRQGAGTSEQVVLSWANARLAKHQRLADVVFRKELPRNALGKVLKRALRDEYRSGLLQAPAQQKSETGDA